MLRVHRRYLWLEQGLGAAVLNILINAGIAWLFFRSLDVVPLWGAQSIGGDTIGTAFVLPFLTCLIVTRLAQRDVRRGRFPPPEWRRSTHPVLRHLPQPTFARGIVFGGICMVLVAPAAIAILEWLQVSSLDFREFVVFKASFAGALAALVTPPVALCALGDIPVNR